MTPDQALRLQLQDVIRSNIESKYFCDYGVVQAVYGTPVTTVDVLHYVQAYADSSGNPVKNITQGVEVLYPALAGVSIEIPVQVGDGVLLLGTRRYLPQASQVSNAPVAPAESVSYSKETLKAIPLGDLNASSGIYLKFDATNNKVSLKNSLASLYTALNNFESAMATFSSPTSQAAITAGNSTPVTLASAINVLLVAMNASVTAAQTALGQILEA